jgi:hypothetical protein
MSSENTYIQMMSRAPQYHPSFQLPDDEQEETWALLRQRSKDSLFFLNKGVLGFSDLTARLHRPMCNFMQLTPANSPFENARFKATIIPRNHFKSTNGSIGRCCFFLINDPQATINLISAVEDNTIKWLDAIQHIFHNNEMFRWLFPELIPWDDRFPQESKHAFTVPRDEQLMPEPQPSIQATSIVSGQASKHVKHVLLDDPVNEMTVDSPRLVDRAVGLYKLLESTLQDYRESTIDLTATPWGYGDVVESALENEVADGDMMLWKLGCYGDFTTSLNPKEPVVWTLPNSHRQMTTEAILYHGDKEAPIFPERYPRKELERLERKYGTFLFSCNYLCNPYDPSQSGFEEDCLHHFEILTGGRIRCKCHPDHEHWISELHIVMTVDPAFSDKDDAAESAITVAGLAEDGCRFLFKAWADRVESDVLWYQIVKTALEFQPWLKEVGVEAVASQKLFRFWFEFLQQIMHKLPKEEQEVYRHLQGLTFEDLKPDNDIDKIRRIKAQQLPLANGYWHIQYGMSKFMEQFNKFPRARPVDVLDAWAYLDYMWNLPSKSDQSTGTEDEWAGVRRDYHRRRRTYGGGRKRR